MLKTWFARGWPFPFARGNRPPSVLGGALLARLLLAVGVWAGMLGILSCRAVAGADDQPPQADGQTDEADAQTPSPISYWKSVRPILQAHCQGCHQPAKASGEYVMTDVARLMAGGETGQAAIVAGRPDESYLIEQITAVDGEAAMPQDADPLSAGDVALIRQWIEQGAIDDSPPSTGPRFDAEHPPQYTALPVVTSLDVSPRGALLAVTAYHEVIVLSVPELLAGRVETVARLVGMSERLESVRFSPTGDRLAVAGGSPGRLGELQIWDVAAASLIRSLSVGYDTLYGCSWSGDGKLVAFGCPDHSIRAIEVETGQQVFFSGAHNDWVFDTAFSTDDSHLVSVSRDRSMKLYEVATQRFIDNITSITPGALKGGLHSVARHPQRDELLIGGADGVVKLYRMYREQDRKIGDDYNQLREFPELPGRIYSVAFSRDGSLVVAGSSDAGQGHVGVYRTEDGSQIAAAHAIPGGIYTVAFTESAEQFLAAGFDGKLRVGKVADGSIMFELIPVPLAAPESSQAAR